MGEIMIFLFCVIVIGATYERLYLLYWKTFKQPEPPAPELPSNITHLCFIRAKLREKMTEALRSKDIESAKEIRTQLDKVNAMILDEDEAMNYVEKYKGITKLIG